MADNKATGDTSTPNQEASEETTAPSYVTKEELSTIVNAAISNRNKGFEKRFEEFANELRGALGPAKPAEREDPKTGKAADGGETAALRRELEALKKEREAERAKARDLSLRSRVRDELSKVGITNPLALKVLVDADKAVSMSSETEDVVFKLNGEELDLSSGLKAWMKTEDAKIFLPPKGATGSGDRPQGSKVAPKQQEPSGIDILLSPILSKTRL